MYKGKKIIAIIPARCGSKRLPGKNIKKLNGKPMISYAIRAALLSEYVDKVIVATDDRKIPEVAKKWEAEVPCLRPAELATDTARPEHVLQHAVGYLSSNGFNADVIVLIQPTSPFVLAGDIDGAIKKMFETKAGSCIGVCEISERPEWMYQIKRKTPFLFLSGSGTKKRSQELPKLYKINGAVYVVKREVLMNKNKIIDDNSDIFIMPRERSVDIDELIDFKLAEALLHHSK